MCLGRHYPRNEMALAVAMLLWTFNIEILDVEAAKKTGRSMRAFAVGTLTPNRDNRIRIRRREM